MKYSKKDLIQEGWASMETLLNEEMPTNKKDNNYKLIALFVVCAFGIGIITGTMINTKDSTAEVIKIDDSSPVTDRSISANGQLTKLIDPQSNSTILAVNKSISNPTIAEQDQFASHIIYPVTNTSLVENSVNEENLFIADFNQAPSQNFSLSNEMVFKQPTSPSAIIEEETSNGISFLSFVPFKKMVSKGIANASMPKQETKTNEESNWVVGLGMNTGVNVERNTAVVSLNSDWMYKLGKQNSVGVQVLFASEDEFTSTGENPEVSNRPDPKGGESSGRNSNKFISPNSKQHRVATGLIIQQEIGYRFYSNLAFGVDMLQNTYTEDIELRSLGNAQEVKYHLGGYSSIALGYRLSKLVDLEVSGTKSMFLKDASYVPGNSNQIVGGVKINF